MTNTHGPQFDLVIGNLDDARAFVGRRFSPRTGDVAVSESMIQLFCCVTEDSNPSYWDRQFANEIWGGLVAPPAMLMAWLSPLPWRPGRQDRGYRPLPAAIPLPGTKMVNAVHESRFFEPIRVGDQLSIVETLESVSDTKTTHLGEGHFIRTRGEITRANGQIVAEQCNQIFRYSEQKTTPVQIRSTRPPASPRGGELISDIQVPVTRFKAILSPGTTLDIMAGHYDLDFARASGIGGLSLNTAQALGLFNRHATDWAGPRAFITAQRIQMIRPLVENMVAVVSGRAYCSDSTAAQPATSRIVATITDQSNTLFSSADISLSLPAR